MCTFLPKFLKEKLGCALYMDIMNTYYGSTDGYNNPMYNTHKNVGAYYTQQNTVSSTMKFQGFFVSKNY